MTEKSPTPAASAERTPTQDAVELVQTIGQSLNLALLYGTAHKVSQASFDRSYPAIAGFMKRYGPLHVSVAEGDLLLNGNSAAEAPLAANLIARLTGLNLLSLVIDPSLSLEEYRKLLMLLMTPPAKLATTESATDLMTTQGFRHIQAQNIVYRRVDGNAPEPEKAPEPEPPPPAASADLDNVLAFLKGDPQAVPESAREALRELAGDAEKLADLILRTAEIRAQAADAAAGESLTDLVVGCVNRVAGALLETSTTKTQKGCKQTKRSLLLLEKSLLARLHKLGDGAIPSAAVSSAIEEAAEELDTGVLAAKYIKTRRAAKASERKLKRLIDRTGPDSDREHDLRDRLMEQGLTADGWHELVVERKARAAPGTGTPGAEFQDIQALTLLLARLGETLQQPRTEPSAEAALHTLVAETGQQMAKVAAGAERKIAALGKLAESPPKAGTPDGPFPLSRKALLQTLAEIAQELSQPLTIVNATLDMLRSQRPGPLTAAQGEVLALAAESGSRLAHLVHCLMRLAGTPAALEPDRRILEAAYAAGNAGS